MLQKELDHRRKLPTHVHVYIHVYMKDITDEVISNFWYADQILYHGRFSDDKFRIIQQRFFSHWLFLPQVAEVHLLKYLSPR